MAARERGKKIKKSILLSLPQPPRDRDGGGAGAAFRVIISIHECVTKHNVCRNLCCEAVYIYEGTVENNIVDLQNRNKLQHQMVDTQWASWACVHNIWAPIFVLKSLDFRGLVLAGVFFFTVQLIAASTGVWAASLLIICLLSFLWPAKRQGSTSGLQQ